MNIPKGMTEEEVLASIERVANGLAYKYRFGYHGVEDMKQEARLQAIEALDRYDPSRGKLETFLWTHVSNRLFNIKRNKYARPDKPCLDCPLKAYDPECKNSLSQCTEYSDKLNCSLYDAWEKRNSAKKNIMCPIEMGNVKDENESNMSKNDTVADQIDFINMVDLIDSQIPINLRRSWIKLQNDVKMPKSEREKVLDFIKELLSEGDYGS